MDFFVHDPFNGQVLHAYDAWPASRLLDQIHNSWKAHLAWRDRSFQERIKFLEGVRTLMLQRKDDLASTITSEMGKRLSESQAEIEKCCALITHYEENCQKYLTSHSIKADGKKHEVCFEPLGPILSIMPWNFPLWQALRFAIPTLFAGNSLLLKPAPETPLSSMKVEEIFRLVAQNLNYGEDIFIVLLAHLRDLEKVISSPLVRGVSFTGSSESGRKVAELGGRHLKKVLLELGGSDPFIVLPDANLEAVVPEAVRSRMINCGQTCISGKRFLLPHNLKDQFIERMKKYFLDLKIGDPRHATTTLAPIFHSRGMKSLEELVTDAVEKGACVHLGGGPVPGHPQFFSPTILSGITSKMKLYSAEAFGPVSLIFEYSDVGEAIRLANGTPYGLGASVWGQDAAQCEYVARQVECGSIFVNGVVKSDPRVPFGGIKASGFGRELGELGILEFTNAKSYNFY
ncbi:MAG: aldehyde dehydrogenase family protein [Bdellovibrio sp.]|nr:aldehyde dehydrogenase family protein [Bdellovibrio sp.]